MSNLAVVGTPVSFTADGNTFSPAADADPTYGKPKYEGSVEMSTGRAFRKMVRQAESIEGLTLKCTSDEMETLKELSDRIAPYPMSYKNIAGDVFKGHGWVAITEGWKAQSGNVTVSALVDENGWVMF